MKIALHTAELKPTTLAAIIADMTNMIGADYAEHYNDNHHALIDSYNALIALVGADDAEIMLLDADADLDVIDAYRRLATAN